MAHCLIVNMNKHDNEPGGPNHVSNQLVNPGFDWVSGSRGLRTKIGRSGLATYMMKRLLINELADPAQMIYKITRLAAQPAKKRCGQELLLTKLKERKKR